MPQLSRVRIRKLWLGLAFMGLALIVPLMFTAESIGVYRAVERGLNTASQVHLMGAPFLIAIKNFSYCTPLYLGAFFVSASFVVTWRGRRVTLLNMALLILIIAVFYRINYHFYGIVYAVGVPCCVIPMLQILLWALDYPYVNAFNKAPVVLTTLAGVQFIDLMPALEHLPFGRDEAAVYMKSVLVGAGLRNTLNVTMCTCAITCFSVGWLILLLIHNENRLSQIRQLRTENSEMIVQARLKEMENRSTQELRHLVHDLKTPLTSIQTLAYVVRLHNQKEEQAQCLPYLDRIEGAVDNMSDMISEILYENHRLPTTSEGLLNIVLAQLSVAPYAQAIQTENRAPEAMVKVNRIRMARAIINLTENSSHAVGEHPLEIRISAEERKEGDRHWLAISVIDNGTGISERDLESIWRRGYSTTSSSGLGMAFVHETVEHSGGRVDIQSKRNQGTQITILLPIGVV